MPRANAVALAERTAKLVTLKRIEDIIEETYYQTREEFCNNADEDDNLDWLDSKIEAALEKFKAELDEQLTDITDEVLNANNAGR